VNQNGLRTIPTDSEPIDAIIPSVLISNRGNADAPRAGIGDGRRERSVMAGATPDRYDLQTTALPHVDPYNDFISEGGKLWERCS